MPDKNWAEKVVANARNHSDLNEKIMNMNSALKAAASPYEVVIHENTASYGIKIVLVDNRQEPPAQITVKVPQKIAIHGGFMNQDVIRKAIEAAKSRLQKKLAENCDEPEIRLWAAQNRDVDLMDNSEIPSRIRIAYARQNVVTDEELHLSRQEKDRIVSKATEQTIESDSGPVFDTPPPRRRIVRRSTGRLMTVPDDPDSGESTQDEVKTNVPVATVKGAHSKMPKRKPRCNNRDHEEPPEMEFDAEAGLWKCPEGCGTVAYPKSDSPVGRIQLGRGRLDFRVLFVEPGKKPSILLVADNNVAIDVTDYVDMDNFLKYSSAQAKAQNAANAGQEVITAKNYTGKDITVLLKFPEMKVYGCDNA